MHDESDPLTTHVAVIGMAGRFPGAADLESYWRNLCQGVTSLRRFSDDELVAAGFDPHLVADPNFVPAAGVIDGADQFDAALFGYSPRDAALMDPQQRWFLQCSWEAFESAGYDPQRYAGLIGVYGGATTSSYRYQLDAHPELTRPGDGMAIALGNDLCFLTTRVSHRLDLRGPSCPVQTACSTSLVAIHLACQALLNAECDMAIAGAASIRVPLQHGYLYQPGGILSPDGVCRPFDAKAEGTLFSSGVGVVLLKRLHEALDDGDTIHAVIKGSAVNNDGSHKASFTAPSVTGQSEVIADALAAADVTPESITFIETHGTGTLLGDSIEVQALRDAFAERPSHEPSCALGSVKANLGHLDAAAGIAGFIKAVMAVREGMLPPTPCFEEPNPDIDFESTPFRVQTRLERWQTAAGPRRAGVSSFGFGGTNAHVILEQPPAARSDPPARRVQLLPLSTEYSEGLEIAAARLAAHLRQHPEVRLADAASTLQIGRRCCRYRRAIVCRDIADALQQLENDPPASSIRGFHDQPSRQVVFLLPSHVSHTSNFAVGNVLALMKCEKVFEQAMLRCDRALRDAGGEALIDHLNCRVEHSHEQSPAFSVANSPVLNRIGCFAAQWSLAQLWSSWGIQPSALLANGIGEFVAACLSGVLTCEQAVRLLAKSDFAGEVATMKFGAAETAWFSCASGEWFEQAAGHPWHQVLEGVSDLDGGARSSRRRTDCLYLDFGAKSQLGDAVCRQLGSESGDCFVASLSESVAPVLEVSSGDAAACDPSRTCCRAGPALGARRASRLVAATPGRTTFACSAANLPLRGRSALGRSCVAVGPRIGKGSCCGRPAVERRDRLVVLARLAPPATGHQQPDGSRPTLPLCCLR